MQSLRSHLAGSYTKIPVKFVKPGWHTDAKVPATQGWYFIETDTPFEVLSRQALWARQYSKKKTSESDGVTNPMSVDAIARLAGLTAETAVVRRRQGEDGPVGDPLTGEVAIKNGDHFVVTRRTVEGGHR